MAKSAPNKKIFTKKIIGLIFLVAIVLGALFLIHTAFSSNKERVEVLLSVDFPGISSGVNPDGTKFDISDILKDETLQKVVERLSLNFSTEDLRGSIEIQPVYPCGIVDKVLSARRSGDMVTFHPSEFYLRIDTGKLNKLNKNSAANILATSVDEYQKEFYAIYADKGLLDNVMQSLDLENFDYPDIVKVIRSQIEVINTYLTDKELEARDFRSKSTNYSFGDLVQALEVIKDVDLNKIDSMIASYNLTKDKEKLILSYRNIIKRLELEREKKLGEFQKAREMMDIFERDQNIVYMAGGSVTQLESGSYYDELTDRATAAKVEADNINHDIEYYQKEIERLINEIMSTGEKKQVEKDLNMSIDNLKEKLISHIELINITLDEYNMSKIGNAFKIIDRK